MKIFLVTILLFTTLSCSNQKRLDNDEKSIFNDTLDHNIEYIKNIQKYIRFNDTILTKTYIDYGDSSRYGFGGIIFGSCDSNNNIIKRNDLYFEYNKNGAIKNKYITYNSNFPLSSVSKFHYYYDAKEKLHKVDCWKYQGKDTIINYRNLLYDAKGNMLKEIINNFSADEKIIKGYKDSQLVYVDIFRSNNKIMTSIRLTYYYEKGLLSQIKEHNDYSKATTTHDYHYDANKKLVSSRDTTMGIEFSKSNHNLFNFKKYEYDNIGRLVKIYTTDGDYITPKYIQVINYKTHHNNCKLRTEIFGKMSYYNWLRFN